MMGSMRCGHGPFVTLFTCLTGCSLAACGTSSPTSPSGSSVITFEFDGTLRRSCAVPEVLHACDDAPFGSGIVPGTAISGHLRFDPHTPGVDIVGPPGVHLVSYVGVAVDFTIGSSLVSGNDSSIGALEVDSYPSPQSDQFGVTISRGFRNGQVAGLSVDFFSLILPIVPSRFPDASLPRDPSIFDRGLQSPGASVFISHYASPDVWPFGLDAPGSRLEGQIEKVKLLQ